MGNPYHTVCHKQSSLKCFWLSLVSSLSILLTVVEIAVDHVKTWTAEMSPRECGHCQNQELHFFPFKHAQKRQWRNAVQSAYKWLFYAISMCKKMQVILISND